MTSADLLWAVRVIAERLELVGADVVEVIPTAVGSADVTALVADRIVREALTGMLCAAAYTDCVQEVLDVPNEVAVELAGIGDGVLTALRERLGCAINLRGNRLTLEGEDAKVGEAKAVVEELVDLVESGQEIGAGTVDTILERGSRPSSEMDTLKSALS